MIIAECENAEQTPDLASLLADERRHTVVTRNLGARYQAPLRGTGSRYAICPAYFNEAKEIVVYEPFLLTDWLYVVSRARARAVCTPLRFSQYQQVRLSVRFSNETQRADEFATQALRYSIHENKRLIGHYPLDPSVVAGEYAFHIKKNQQVTFSVEEDYAHLLVLDGK